MFNIAKELAARYISKREVKKIQDPEVVYDDNTGNIYLVFRWDTGKTNKKGEPIVRLYKNNITKPISEHGGLENFYKTLVASEMMLAGYFIVPIENGWVCVGGSEVYAMKDNECTCQAFVLNPSKPCKHLIYKEALLMQRSKINEWKRSNL